MSTRVILVDDNNLFRQGLRSMIGAHAEFEVVADLRGGREAVQASLNLNPDLMLMDIVLSGVNGLETVPQIKRRLPSVKVLMLTSLRTDDYVREALRARRRRLRAQGRDARRVADGDALGGAGQEVPEPRRVRPSWCTASFIPRVGRHEDVAAGDADHARAQHPAADRRGPHQPHGGRVPQRQPEDRRKAPRQPDAQARACATRPS